MRSKRKIKKKIILGIVFTLIFLVILFMVLVVKMALDEIKEEEVLKQEIINYSNKDLLTDDYKIEVKTTGDYAYVEEAVKKYYKELSDNIKIIGSYLGDEQFLKILSYENLVLEKPEFVKSHMTIKETKNRINEAFSNIKELCDEKKIKNLVDKDKLDDEEYYYDLYLQFVGTKKDIKRLEEAKKEYEKISNNLNKYLDKVDEILNFLSANSSVIQYTNNTLYFYSETSLSEYNRLQTELTNILTDMGAKPNKSNENSNNKIEM